MLNDDVFTEENIPSGRCVSCVLFTELLIATNMISDLLCRLFSVRIDAYK